MQQTIKAIRMVIETGKVAVVAVVSVYGEGAGKEISLKSGTELIRACLEAWKSVDS